MPEKLKQTKLKKAEGDQTPAPRKRAQQLRTPTSDDEPKKRVKKAKPPAAAKKGRGTRGRKAATESFGFQVKDVMAETPKLSRGKQVSDDDMDISSMSGNDGFSTTSTESRESEGITSAQSVSIRKVGKSRKIPDVGSKKREKAGLKGSEILADLYVSFDPKRATSWKQGENVPYKVLSDTFHAIEQTTKRLEITRLLTECFRCIMVTTPEDLLSAVYLCVNQVAPAHEGLELGVGDSILVKAIANVSGGGDIAKIKKQYDEDGDLGSVAMSRKGGQNLLVGFAPLTIHEVFKKFVDIAKDSGDKSQERKRNMIERLLTASKGNETKFITRSLQGKLRIGLAEMTVLQAIGQAFFMEGTDLRDHKGLMQRMEKAAELVKQVYSTCPSYERLINCMLNTGLEDLDKRLSFTPGIPVQPMLAKATTGIAEVVQKFEGIPFTCEFKYDGERSQVHVLDNKSVMIYTRNAENVTGKYPDIVKRVPEFLKPGINSVVLDCECVAFDIEANKILPFQRLSTRARKDVTLSNIKVHVCLFCFDCLYLNGASLLDKPLTERREALYRSINTEPGIIQFAENQTSSYVEALQDFLDLAVQGSTEGLIVKTLDCTYEPSKRSVNWLKLKKDYLEGVGDSFDLVVIGAWHGKGKRTGVFGSFLLAAYDPINDEYQSVCKIGTGFSEEDLENFTQALKDIAIGKPPANYSFGETLSPDVWFHAQIVWEVKAADLSISPVHKAGCGIVDETKGISIRFPRFVRVRDDKRPNQATTSEQVAQMYRDQGNNAGSS